ncbi:Hsp33 family molecular chaperone HslO [Chitinibacter bivalviorum]|uniref:33 kDa chaperonin n=1 Tax=Chitinibacter bivalviorum TaxID=2739434 RepID=A0A7H9BI92_9NEIS|nr:Hsp33 family molecular chaperone HslO [Chitinibacter bivalviorum]QLG88062.1 Hsp33 family molecular chaperone HslO [Chitinibacter bivalviorum]
MKDVLERFLFDKAPVRGEMVKLDATYKEVLARHDYPEVLKSRIGELMAAGALLSAMLKFDGTLIMQMQGMGALQLLVVEVTSQNTLRATARWDAEKIGAFDEKASVAELLGRGRFMITLDPTVGEAYQGVVGMEVGQSVAQIIEHYMTHSEQLDTRLWLACEDGIAAGMMLQKMPAQDDQENTWEHLVTLADTVKAEELLQLEPRETLYRLFHEDSARVFDPASLRFACTCSRERVGGMIKLMERHEVDEVIAERGHVHVVCDFCGKEYTFDPVDIGVLYSGSEGAGSATLQ